MSWHKENTRLEGGTGKTYSEAEALWRYRSVTKTMDQFILGLNVL
jgi:hypothetical protein